MEEGTRIHIEIPNEPGKMSIPGMIDSYSKGVYTVVLEVDAKNTQFMKPDAYSNGTLLGQGDFQVGEYVQFVLEEPFLPLTGDNPPTFLVSGKIDAIGEECTITYIPYTFMSSQSKLPLTVAVNKNRIQKESFLPGMSVLVFKPDSKGQEKTNYIKGKIINTYCDRTAEVELIEYRGNQAYSRNRYRMNYEHFYVLTSTYDTIIKKACLPPPVATPVQGKVSPIVVQGKVSAPDPGAVRATVVPVRKTLRNRFWSLFRKGGKSTLARNVHRPKRARRTLRRSLKRSRARIGPAESGSSRR
jgi:hypothetical protein